MGDQRPMETLSGVVEAVLGPDGKDASIRRWSKPYVGQDGSFDLRGITTERIGESQRRYDFYEFYWAHLMSGTRFVAMALWLCDLAKRERKSLPRDARWLWFVIVAVLIGAAMAFTHVAWVVMFGLVGLNVEVVADRQAKAAIPIATVFVAMGLGAAALARFRFKTSWAVAFVLLAVFGGLAALGWWRGTLLFTLVPLAAMLFMFFGIFATISGLVIVCTVTTALYFAGLLSGFHPGFAITTWVDYVLMGIQAEQATLWLIGYLVFFGLLSWVFLVPYVGDAACYLRDAPDNIEARSKIRALGLSILDDLHRQTSNGSTAPRYDRIVVVAHSLGSVIAYDVMRAFFVKQVAKVDVSPPLATALAEIDGLAKAAIAPAALKVEHAGDSLSWALAGAPAATAKTSIDFRRMQKDAFKGFLAHARPRQATPGEPDAAPWRISDLVTAGSPLTHAVLLLTEGGKAAELEAKVQSREFPVAPPAWSNDEDGRVLYGSTRRKIQHSALFALTAWTNLYFSQKAVVNGDFIGGPISPDLSPGTCNVPLTTSLKAGLFNHTDYWRYGPEGESSIHIRALKLAILGDDALAEVSRQRRSRSDSGSLAI
jgi:hypothetical protein